jgi:hypothetical protein
MGWRWKRRFTFSEATTRDSGHALENPDIAFPVERRSAALTEKPFLFVRYRHDETGERPRNLVNVFILEIRRPAKRAAGSPFAIVAMADGVDRGLTFRA